MDEQHLDRSNNLDNIVLALLFASDEPLSLRRISAILEDEETEDIRKALEAWRARFDDEAWSIAVEQVAGGFQVVTRTDYAPFVGRLYSKKRKLRLSRAGLETLAIIAYKQPVTRADIENVRGVSSGGVVTNLMERSLIKITGKARVLGAPFLYGTTPEFLEYLGLNSLKDLPSLAELEAMLEKEAHPESAVSEESLLPSERSEHPSVAVDPEESNELYEATAAEVAAAMAAVNEARDAIPTPGSDAPKEGEAVAEPAAAAEPDATASDPPAPIDAPAAARVGPALHEPVNRPLGTTPSGDDDRDDSGASEPPVKLDEREDER